MKLRISLALLSLVASVHAENARPSQTPKVTFSGYVESSYQVNFNLPHNDLTTYRGFDNRHNTFTLANTVLDASWEADRMFGKFALQFGTTPSAYYGSEPGRSGASGVNASNAELWKYLQQGYAGYRFANGIEASMGLFLSPVGPETIAIKENWNWSRSTLFFALPYYHTGVKFSVPLWKHGDRTIKVNTFALNGWNSVVDNNDEISLSTQFLYESPKTTAALLYFGGVERPPGAMEGRSVRHMVDAYAKVPLSDALSFLVHGNVGFEKGRTGTASWLGGAVSARLQLAEPLAISARIDALRESLPSPSSTYIFFPSLWFSSYTLTADVKPHSNLLVRLEGRHDVADAALFSGVDPRFNRRAQTTVTLGITAWF